MCKFCLNCVIKRLIQLKVYQRHNIKVNKPKKSSKKKFTEKKFKIKKQQKNLIQAINQEN